MSSGRQWLAAPLLALALAVAMPQRADAGVVEKVVAVVGDDSILLSELRGRSAPLIRVLVQQVPAGPQRTAAESQVYKDMLTQMVTEMLEAQAAERLKVTVAPEEIDRALENVANQQKMTVDELLDAASAKSGLSEMEYRAEIRRQVLEGKLLSQRVRGRIRITDEDLKNAFARSVREERERREYRPSMIMIKIPTSASNTATQNAAAAADKEKIIKSIHARLDGGESFPEIAKELSEEPTSAAKGGDLGVHAPIKTQAAQSRKRPALAKEIEDRIIPLEPGQYTEPFRVGDAWVIFGLQARQQSRYTTFEAAKEEMAQRVQNDILAREKETWLEELKKRTHVETRL
jgi:peptidyl-prolyl cis-trans isomerase SurA